MEGTQDKWSNANHVDIDFNDPGGTHVREIWEKNDTVFAVGSHDIGGGDRDDFIAVMMRPERFDANKLDSQSFTEMYKNQGGELIHTRGTHANEWEENIQRYMDNGHDPSTAVKKSAWRMHGMHEIEAGDTAARFTLSETDRIVQDVFPEGPTASKQNAVNAFFDENQIVKGGKESEKVAYVQRLKQDVKEINVKDISHKLGGFQSKILDVASKLGPVGKVVQAGSVLVAGMNAARADDATPESIATAAMEEMPYGEAKVEAAKGNWGDAIKSAAVETAEGFGVGEMVRDWTQTPQERVAYLREQQSPHLEALQERFPEGIQERTPEGIKNKPLDEALRNPNTREKIKEVLGAHGDEDGLNHMSEFEVTQRQIAEIGNTGISAPQAPRQERSLSAMSFS